MPRPPRRIRPIERLVATHITKIGLKNRFFSGLLEEVARRKDANSVGGSAAHL
jgi:hypothetical protein